MSDDMTQKMADLPTREEYERAELIAERDAARAEILELHEKVSFLESREVCAAAHDDVETCGYCQRDALEARVEQLKQQLHEAGMPCDCWDSRCSQYALMLQRASFLMQTASKHDPDMMKFISDVERRFASKSPEPK